MLQSNNPLWVSLQDQAGESQTAKPTVKPTVSNGDVAIDPRVTIQLERVIPFGSVFHTMRREILGSPGIKAAPAVF